MKHTPINTLDTLKGEHLTNKKYMILACIHTDSSIFKYSEAGEYFYKNKGIAHTIEEKCKRVINKILRKDVQYIDYFAHLSDRDPRIFKKKFTQNDHNTVISNINTQDKYSIRYYNCTGLVIIGKDRKTGKNISLLTHQDPGYFLVKGGKEEFKKTMREIFVEIQSLCVKGTIDVAILGGTIQQNYQESIELLDNLAFESFGFHPVVIGGASMSMFSNLKNIFLDTKNRRIHYVKQEGMGNHSHYMSHMIPDHMT